MVPLRDAQFAISTFFAASHPNDKCGANGLPLTPNSIKIAGRYQFLSTLEHPNLCRYLDIARGKHERLMVVMEHHTRDLSFVLGNEEYMMESKLVTIAFEILCGLCHLNQHGLVSRNLCLQNVLITIQGCMKLTKYGTYYMTSCGADISFPIGEPSYLSPEVLAAGPVDVCDVDELDLPFSSAYNADIWSLGIILLELLWGKRLYADLSLQSKLQKTLEFILVDQTALDIMCDDHPGLLATLSEQSHDFQELLHQCLTVSASVRPCPSELIRHSLFAQQTACKSVNGLCLWSSQLRCENLELPTYDEEGRVKDLHDGSRDNDHLGERSMDEVYYLWRLAGGDLEMTLRKADLVKPAPPITLMPRFLCREGEVFGRDRDPCEFLDNTTIVLSQEELRQRLECIDEAAYYPLLEEDELSDSMKGTLPTSPSSVDLSETASLPLIIREKDIEYQFHRIILYDRLLKAYPYKRAHIWKEARVDIPPLVRAQVWTTLLEIEGDVQARYDAIDKITSNNTDRQIEVDVPRCHQYHELLSSHIAHHKFKRILKAWVVDNPQYVYWQGLDSLCAPFLLLNFNREALAFACVSAFIPKYLHKFFLKDNSAVIQEYLTVFSHIIAFHDADLSSHLDSIGFIPDLYAIPWFLTMYAHVFPLHKIMYLWDTLLLGNSSFPLFIGVSILEQLRDRLLSYGFNECILLFSDMPEIDIEKVVRDAIKIFCATPKSATYRQHARNVKGDKRHADSRTTLSYYSHDYNQQNSSDLSMDAFPLDELKSEKCVRVSSEDLIELSELRGPAHSRSPTKKHGSSKPKLVVVDVRSTDEYKRGTVPSSINIPFHTAFNSDGQLINSPAVATLNSHRQQIKVIVGNRGKNAANFAGELVSLGYNKVCLLHKGIDILRPTGLLTVPPANI